MRNEITWDEESDSETCIDFDVCLGVNLQVYILQFQIISTQFNRIDDAWMNPQVFTKPFTLLPLSALETPGNLSVFLAS